MLTTELLEDPLARASIVDDIPSTSSGSAPRRTWPLAIAVLLIGLVVTAVVVSGVRRSEKTSAVTAAEQSADSILDEATQLLGTAIEGADTLARLNEATWSEPDAYQTLWASFGPAFGSDSLSVLSVEVEPEVVSDLLASEQATDPSFSLRFLNPDPTPSHLIALRTASLDGVAGTDASSIPGVYDTYIELARADMQVLPLDLRDAVKEDDGQLQILHAHTVQPPFGDDAVRAWTAVQVDTRSLIRPILDDIDADAAVLLTVAAGDVLDERSGSSRVRGSDESVQRVGEAGEVAIDVSVAFGTAPVMDRTSTRLGLAGIVLSSVIALLTLLIGRFRAIQNQARESAMEARVDELTGIPNRRWMVERLSLEDSENSALLFCDLDGFSTANDSWGHEAGDALLRETASRIMDSVGDAADVARFGGDEFVVLISGVEDPLQEAQDAAERITQSLSRPHVLDGYPHYTSASIGIAVSTPELHQSFSELTSAADVALAQSKRTCRGSWSLYDEDLRKAASDRLRLESDLHEALDSADGIIVHYQAIVGADGQPTSFEALVRFRRNDEVLLPGRFLDVVADMGRMGDLGRIVFRQAFADYLANDVSARCTLQINADASLLADPEFPTFLDALLAESGMDAERLIVEIVEDAWEVDQAMVEQNINALAERGLKFAIDDFGVGHSSIGRIIQVPNVTAIKLDRSLTQLLHDPRHEGFTSGINQIAATVGAYLVAEGVETVHDRDAAVRVGITRFQGFLWDVPAEGFELNPLEQAPALPTTRQARSKARSA